MSDSPDRPSQQIWGLLLFFCGLGLVLALTVLSVRDPDDAAPNPYAYRVDEYSSQGRGNRAYREVEQIPLALRAPRGVAVGSDGGICVVGDDRLLLFAADGSSGRVVECSEEPQCVAVAGDGRILTGTVDHVDVRNASGEVIAAWPSLGENALITAIAASPEAVFVADFGGKVVWRFDLEGRLLGQIGREDAPEGGPAFVLPSPGFDVVAAEDGSFWVSNPGRLRVERFSGAGERMAVWGEGSMRLAGFCGCCNPTNLGITGKGDVLTSEKGISRVKVYDDIGQLQAVVAGPESFDEGTTGLDLAVDSQGRVLVLDPVRRALRVFVKQEAATDARQ